MEKLKNENLKKIEIKIVGDNCIVSYPSSKLPSLNEAPTFPQVDNDLRATVDLNLSLSSNSEEDFISNLKEIKKKKKDNESNSKKKLEITNKSIFYSESNLKMSSSDRNINNNSKNEECYVKNSVIKKLNFDLCETKKVFDKNKKLSESDRIQKKNSFLYKNKNAINNDNYNNYNINNYNNILLVNNKKELYGTKKRRNSMFNHELINIKNEEPNKANPKINQSFIRYRPNNSFVLPNPFNNNKHIYFNNNNMKNNIHDKGNITLNKKQSKPKNKKKFQSPNVYNKKRNINNKLDKLTEDKSLVKHDNLKFKSTANFSLTNLDNNKKALSKKNEKKIINKNNNNSKIKENKKSKICNKNIKKLIKTNNINKKNMFCIKKSNKKEVPHLTSIINNNNLKNEKKANFIKNNEYCSLKQYYHLKSPSLLIIQGSSTTPITSTNGCTNYTNCTNSSTINSPSNNTTKIFFKSNLDKKNILKKYHSQNTFLKNMVHNNNNLYYYNNNNIVEIKNLNLGKIQTKNLKNNTNLNKYSNKTFKNNLNINNSYKKASKHRTINPLKNSNINRKILNKCNTNELKNILKSNVKSLHKILAERNINGVYTNNSIIHNRDNTFDINSNLNNNNEMFSNHLKYNNLNI